MLATAFEKHHDEVIADMAETYRIDIYDFDPENSSDDYVARIALYVAQLPDNCRWKRAEYPELLWQHHDYILENIEYDLRVLAWQNSKDGQKGRNRPKLPITPRERYEQQKKIAGTDLEYIDKKLGRSGGK